MTAARTRRAGGVAALAMAMALSGCGWQGLNSIPLPGTQGGGPGSFTVQAQMPDVDNVERNSRVRVGDVNVGDANVGEVSRVDGGVSRVDGDVSRVDASVGDASVVNGSVADVTQRAARLLSSFRAANGSIFQRPQQDASMFDPADVVFTSSPSMMQTPGGPILGASAVSATPSTALPSPLERVMQVRCPHAL